VPALRYADPIQAPRRAAANDVLVPGVPGRSAAVTAPDVVVRCEPGAGGWSCSVRVTDDGSSTEHTVRVTAADLARLDPAAPDPTDLVRRSFAFLLERESKQSILRSFDLGVIGRYFPEYEGRIMARD
jgi:hypothetical protein